jgi:hypothetical protein
MRLLLPTICFAILGGLVIISAQDPQQDAPAKKGGKKGGGKKGGAKKSSFHTRFTGPRTMSSAVITRAPATSPK